MNRPAAVVGLILEVLLASSFVIKHLVNKPSWLSNQKRFLKTCVCTPDRRKYTVGLGASILPGAPPPRKLGRLIYLSSFTAAASFLPVGTKFNAKKTVVDASKTGGVVLTDGWTNPCQ